MIRTIVALKDGRKLVCFIKQNETELYNLDKGVGEKNDLPKVQPERARELLSTLNERVEQTRETQSKSEH